MANGSKNTRKTKRPYIRLCDRRRRGGQPGNRNAYKIGLYTAFARAKRREIWLLLQEICWALAAAQPFVEKAKDHPKKSKTNGADCLDGASGCADGPRVKSHNEPKKLRKTPEPRDAYAQERRTRNHES